MIKYNESNKFIDFPKGKKVVVEAVEVKGNGDISFEYNIYLADELSPLHKLQEEPIRDYSDYIEGESFFKSKEEMVDSLKQSNILSFIKEYHPEVMEYIENKGIVLYPKWIPYQDLV